MNTHFALGRTAGFGVFIILFKRMPFIGFICDVNKKTRRMQNMWYVFFSFFFFIFAHSLAICVLCHSSHPTIWSSRPRSMPCLLWPYGSNGSLYISPRTRTYINYGWKTELKLTHVIYVVIVSRSLRFFFGSVWTRPNSIWTAIKKGSNRQEFIESNIFPFITQCNLEW